MKLAHGLVRRRDEDIQMFGLRVFQRLAGIVHGRVRHIFSFQATAPFAARASGEDRRQYLDQGFLIVDAAVAVGEPRVLEQRRLLDRVRQPAEHAGDEDEQQSLPALEPEQPVHCPEVDVLAKYVEKLLPR